MPTDGTLFLENLPYSKQYLLTLLSVFFSLGAVLSSTVSYIFLPGASCRVFEGCDIAGKANDGWRKVLLVLGLFVSFSEHSDRAKLIKEPGMLIHEVGTVPTSRISSIFGGTWPRRRGSHRPPGYRHI